MKKSIAVILTAFYLILTGGLSVSIHLCSGMIESMQLGENKTSCCCDKAQEQADCCENENYIFRLTIDQHPVNSTISIDPVTLDIPDSIENYKIDVKNNPQHTALQYTYLPPPSRHPKWIMHCSLTYYG